MRPNGSTAPTRPPAPSRCCGSSRFIGRGFLASDDAAGAAPVALLSRTAWLARYGGDRGSARPRRHDQWRTVDDRGHSARRIGLPRHRRDLDAAPAGAGPSHGASGCADAAGLRTPHRSGRRRRGRRRNRSDCRAAGERSSGHQPQRARARVPDQRTIPRQPDRSRLARVHDRRLHRRPDLLRERRQPDARSVGAALPRAGDSGVGGRQPRQAPAAAARRERRRLPPQEQASDCSSRLEGSAFSAARFPATRCPTGSITPSTGGCWPR